MIKRYSQGVINAEKEEPGPFFRHMVAKQAHLYSKDTREQVTMYSCQCAVIPQIANN